MLINIGNNSKLVLKISNLILFATIVFTVCYLSACFCSGTDKVGGLPELGAPNRENDWLILQTNLLLFANYSLFFSIPLEWFGRSGCAKFVDV